MEFTFNEKVAMLKVAMEMPSAGEAALYGTGLYGASIPGRMALDPNTQGLLTAGAKGNMGLGDVSSDLYDMAKMTLMDDLAAVKGAPGAAMGAGKDMWAKLLAALGRGA